MQKLFSKILIFLSLFSFGFFASAQEFEVEYERARVIGSHLDENETLVYDVKTNKGYETSIYSFGLELKEGNRIFIEKDQGGDQYFFTSVDRSGTLIFLVVFFVLAIILLARKKGLKALFSLALSFALLFFVLVPLLIRGYDPVWTSLFFGTLVLALTIFLTHGYNKQSLSSFLGSLISIIFASGLLYFVVKASSLSGYLSEDIQYLSIELENGINLVRLVSAGIIIGVLGVLDDITITQVAVVRELALAGGKDKKSIFAAALRVGRDHVSSLVNTLVFAYVGAALPLIMLVSIMPLPWFVLLSKEFIFVEIVRSLVGVLALMLAVPVTTWISVYIFKDAIIKDEHTVESACAHHHHH